MLWHFLIFKNNEKTAYSRVGKALILYPFTSQSHYSTSVSLTKRVKSQGMLLVCRTSSNMKKIWKCLHITLNITLDRFNQIISFTRITVADQLHHQVKPDCSLLLTLNQSMYMQTLPTAYLDKRFDGLLYKERCQYYCLISFIINS